MTSGSELDTSLITGETLPAAHGAPAERVLLADAADEADQSRVRTAREEAAKNRWPGQGSRREKIERVMHYGGRSLVPEGPKTLAGGVSHRFSTVGLWPSPEGDTS